MAINSTEICKVIRTIAIAQSANSTTSLADRQFCFFVCLAEFENVCFQCISAKVGS